MKVSGVYGIVHERTGRVYVGSSCDVQRRWRDHVGTLNKGRHSSGQLLDLWLLDGPGAFAFVLFERCGRGRLATREQVWLDSFVEPLNASLNTQSHSLDPRVAAKISRAHTDPPLERRAAMAERLKGRANPAVAVANRRRWAAGYRIVVRDKKTWRARLSASHLGQSRAHTAAARAKTANAVRARWADPAYREKQRAAQWSRTPRAEAIGWKISATKRAAKARKELIP